jgi:hypothetical protein
MFVCAAAKRTNVRIMLTPIVSGRLTDFARARRLAT